MTPLLDLCEFIVDCEHKTAPLSASGYPSIRTPNVGRGRLTLEGVNRVDEPTYRAWTRRAIPQADDLIIAREAPVGNVAIVRPGEVVCLGQRTVLVRPNKQKVDPEFLCYYMLGDYVQGQFRSASTGSTVAHLNMRDIRNLPVPNLPDLPTQRRTASILSAYDDLMENNSRRITVLEEMARRVHEEWFVRFRYPGHGSGDGPENLPPGWRRAPIADAYEGLFDGPHATPAPADAGPVFLGIGNIREEGGLDLSSVRHIAEEDFAKWTKRVTPREGDIVFTYEATLNRYALIPKGFRGCLGRRLALIRTRPESRRNLFLYLHFFSADWREVITQNTLSGATVDRIPLSKLPQFPITLPPDDLIHRFDDIVRPMFEQVEVLRRKNTNLRAQRDLLLLKLISVEIDVSEAVEHLEATQ